MTVTDNAANFVKAFKEFKRTEEDDGDNDTDDDVTVHDVDNILDADTDDDTVDVVADEALYLPPHQRCASHTLNLVAVSDTEVANQDAGYKRVSRAALSKCTALWNKTSRSTVSADIVTEKLNTCFIVPNDTRWNSQFRAVDKIKKLLEQQPEHMREVCLALGVVPFHENETNFINEYCNVMQPLACSLDILQGETKCFIGYLLPTLSTLEMKLRALRSNLKVAAPLVDAILTGLANRFAGYHERQDLILASITLPQFRLRWLDDSKKASARCMLYEMSRALTVVSDRSADEPSSSQEDEFFTFMAQPERHESVSSEVDCYLSDPSKDLSLLHKYPSVLKLFVKFNTALPSSAPVERLFSLGGQIFVPRRNRLSDASFERQLLLRANKLY